MTPSVQHQAVMTREILALFGRDVPGVYVDGTLGAGGHSRALLQSTPPPRLVIGIDRDPDCIAAAQQWGRPWEQRFRAVQGDFRHLTDLLSRLGLSWVDGILLDLGASSHQLDTPARGFSFRLDGPLDMRMDPAQPETASALLNRSSVEELVHLFRTLGEERWSRRIAQAIVTVRQQAPITQTRHLAALVEAAIPRAAWPRHIHPATRIFQALRMAVNSELSALAEVLPQAVMALRPGGLLGVIAFHSLEDRLVKQFFVQQAKGCTCPPRMPQCVCGQRPRLRLVTRKPVRPSLEEVQDNPRSRSARFRVAARLEGEA